MRSHAQTTHEPKCCISTQASIPSHNLDPELQLVEKPFLTTHDLTVTDVRRLWWLAKGLWEVRPKVSRSGREESASTVVFLV